MNLEDLTKTQIVLLALLISFVTAIATAITTTALLEEAPITTTQTINRIVTNTVERVIPTEVESDPETVVETVFVSEEDAIRKAVSSVLPSVLSLNILVGETNSGTIGVFIEGGKVLIPRNVTENDKVTFISGEETKTLKLVSNHNTFSILEFEENVDIDEASLFDGEYNIAERIISITVPINIETSIISSLSETGFGASINTNKDSILFNTEGEIVGLFAKSGVESNYSIVSSSEILKEI